jgi:aldose sugar dehydrogenase
MTRSLPFTTLACLVAACSTPAASSTAQGCTPLETRSPNAAGQKPAVEGQTRGCGLRNSSSVTVTVVARGLDHPWSVEPLANGDFLVTEKPGRLRIVSAGGVVGAPITGLPPVDSRGQGGLLDVALSPSFETDRTIFWSFSEPDASNNGSNGTAVARGVLSADRKSVSDVRVIFRVVPKYAGTMHYGSRLAWSTDGKLFITTGERSDANMRPYAQRLDSHLGKVLRINPDGSSPADNPFVSQAGAESQIYSLGHRNIQAASVDPQGRLWIIEHGTNGGDELNLIEAGKNYGWPRQAYGEEYSGARIGSAETVREGMQQPVYYWDPVIAPSGAQWYTGNAFPAWKGNLFVGALKEQRLVRLVIDKDRVVGEEHLLTDRGQRIRDVRQGPDGFLYIVTDAADGQLWKVSPGK